MKEKQHNIPPIPNKLDEEIWKKINQKTKPIGSLGRLEELAFKIARIQQTLSPQLHKPSILIFASDHGIVEEGVSAYPQEVTAQMVLNFLNGGAAINVFARQHDLSLQVIDAGVKSELPPHENLIHGKVDYGTKNLLHGPAMSKEQCNSAILEGAKIIKRLSNDGCNLIG